MAPGAAGTTGFPAGGLVAPGMITGTRCVLPGAAALGSAELGNRVPVPAPDLKGGLPVAAPLADVMGAAAPLAVVRPC